MATKAEDAVRRRRERGRRSQAGFRKRQAEANQHVRDQNLRLKSAIEKLIHATRGDEDPELLNTIFDVAEAAGVDAPRPVIGAQCDDDTTTIATTTTATTAVRPRPDKHVSGNGNNSRLLTSPVDGEEEEDITIDATTRDIVRKVGDHQASPSYSSLLAPPVFSASPPQRLTCGIWLDHLHYMRVSIPPDDILPYLGPGSKTFAGILFWSMMDHSQMKCPRKPQHPHNDAASLIRRALGHSQVTAGWAVTYVQAMVEARQEYKRTGSISRRYASFAEQDLGMIIRDRISAEYYARGQDPDRWLSTLDIEKRVRGLVGADAFALLDAAARGAGNPALRRSFDDLECKLHETCICFGDGPRWNVEVVDALFLGWVRAAFWST